MVKARKRFGQHFLTDTEVLSRITSAVSITAGDAVLEIGPGRGALTEYLHAAAQDLHAIELDRDLVPLLRARYPDLTLTEGDVLSEAFDGALAAREGWRLVGNLPYNISSPFMLRLAELTRAKPELIRDGHFMVQREMALRMAAEPGTKAWGRLSVMLQLHFAIEILFDVPPETFDPPPKVDSSVLRMQPLPKLELSSEHFGMLDSILKTAFAARRKRLANALKRFDVPWAETEVDADLRADQVDAASYVKLTQVLYDQQIAGENDVSPAKH